MATESLLPQLAPHPYVKCSKCTLGYQPNMGTKVYEADHEINGSLMSNSDKSVNENLAKALFENHIIKKVDPQYHTHFDIGCKYPYLGHCLQKLGMKSYGLDGIPECLDFGKELGVSMIFADFETFDIPKDLIGEVGLITLVHCLEHIYKPVESIRRLRDIISPDGVLFIRCPDSEAKGIERDFTQGHYSIHPTLWNEHAMYELLAKLEDCFIVEETYLLHGQRDYILRPITSRPTIGAGLIVKNEEKDILNCLRSLPPVDQLCIRDTGSVDNTKEVVLSNHSCDYQTYLGASTQDTTGDWLLWDFAKARNEYVKALDPNVDWLLWMDADDIASDGVKNAIRLAPYMPYDIHRFTIKAHEDHNSGHSHHRLWRTKQGVAYLGACHEYPYWPASFRVKTWPSSAYIKHVYDTGNSGIFRNLRILEHEVNITESPSHRMLFYLGNTYRDAVGIPENTKEQKDYYCRKAIETYGRYQATRSSFWEESMMSLTYTARCYRLLGEWDKCIETVNNAVSRDPSYAELYMEACYASQSKADIWGAISWALRAKDLPFRQRLFAEYNKYTDQPLRQLAHLFYSLGANNLALFWGRKVFEYVKEDIDWIAFLKKVSGVININRPGAIGDVLLTGWVLKGLKKKHPNCKLRYYTKTPEMAKLLVDVDEVIDSDLWPTRDEGYDYPLLGYPLKEGYPDVPMKKHLIEYFSEECGVAYATPSLVHLEKPEGSYITIHIKTGWSKYKEWPKENWDALIPRLKKAYEISVIQVGGAGDPLVEGVVDLRGKTSIKGTMEYIAGAWLHIGGDSFTNHASGVLGTKAVILFGSTSPTGSGYASSLNIWKNLPCSPCYKENPEISANPRGDCEHEHACLRDLSVEDVFNRIKEYI